MDDMTTDSGVGTGGMGDMNMTDGGMMMMAMYFNFRLPVTVVWKEWEITETKMLIASCFGVFGVAILYELLKNMRQIWNEGLFHGDALFTSQVTPPSSGDCCHSDDGISNVNSVSGWFWLGHFTQSLLYIGQTFVAYVLMLVVMTYNVWLVVAVCCGAGTGYFVAGAIRVGVAASRHKHDSNDKLRESSSEADSLKDKSAPRARYPENYVYDNYNITSKDL